MPTAAGKIKLKLSASFTAILKVKNPSSLITLEREVPDGTTIGKLLHDLVQDYPGFRELLLNADGTDVSERIDFVLNRALLQGSGIAATKLHSGDTLFLLPVYEGG